MKILILVLSCLNEPFYSVMNVQQRTWDSANIDGVKTIYYYGGGSGFKTITPYSREFGANTTEDYNLMHWKFILTVREIINEDWDFIFRTNTSSYVDKHRLKKFAEILPKEKCYCGIDVDGFASGAGMFLSKDVVNICLNNFTQNTQNFEDVYMGEILNKHGIKITPGALRCDYYGNNFQNDFSNNKCYHFRCKRIEYSKEEYIKAMEWFFNNIKN